MRIYAVGGAIRDRLMGLPVHDIDYVVVGSSVDDMLAQGFRPVGKDFPVFLHPQTQAEYALARTERKTARGYKGFMFYADPTVTLEEDLERRDLTINAMAQEVDAEGNCFGPIIDPYNGQDDLSRKIFRHVSNAFAEDPLRLLRVARFAARFPEFNVAAETLEALKAIVYSDELTALSSERIWQELARGLIASKPMRMLQVLLDTGAAKILLPLNLVGALADEAGREELMMHLHVSKPCLENRCAVLLMHLPVHEIQAWSEALKMPHEVRDYSVIFSSLQQFLKQYVAGNFQAQDVLAWFNRADVWRKPERAQEILQLGQQVGMNINLLNEAMSAAQKLNSAEIIAGLPEAERLQGEHIRNAVEMARLTAIAHVLQRAK